MVFGPLGPLASALYVCMTDSYAVEIPSLADLQEYAQKTLMNSACMFRVELKPISLGQPLDGMGSRFCVVFYMIHIFAVYLIGIEQR